MQLKIEHLSFTYDGAPEAVFADLSLSLDTAWRTGLIARNGRGKTTLLRLLSGDLQGKGKIDCPLTPVLFPYPVADGTQTAWQIAQTAAATCEDWRLMRELSLLNVPEEALNRPFDTLSGGEQTRVMLSALFAREDAYPLIDEPTNSLDAPGRAMLADYLRRKDGFLLVSHDRAFLNRAIDHVVCLNKANTYVMQGNYDTFEARLNGENEAEAARNENAVYIMQHFANIVVFFHFFGIYPFNFNFAFVGNGSVFQGFCNADICVVQFNILAYNGNGYFAVIMFQDARNHFMPFFHIFRLVFHVQFFQYNCVKPLFFHQHRHFINAFCRKVLNNCFRVNVAEHSHFFAHIFGNRPFAAANKDIRRNADAAQFFNTVLSRFGFKFTGSGNIRNQSYMDIQNIVFADFFFYLADCFEERQAFNIADSTANFGNYKISIVITPNAVNTFFNFVGNVRNYLYGTAQIIAAAFFIDNGKINFAGSYVRAFRQVNVDKAFIVP